MPSAKSYHLSLRLWHWLNAAAILGLFLTALARESILELGELQALILSKVPGLGAEDATNLAKLIRRRAWEWHYTFGYLLTFTVILRLWSLKIAKNSVWPEFKAELSRIRSKDPKASWHQFLVKASYILTYLALGYMVISGLLMHFKAELGLAENPAKVLREGHEIFFWYLLVFSSAHLLGLVNTELREEPGIISRMIHGKKSP